MRTIRLKGYKKGRGRKRGRRTRSRLADKKINTLVEKRMVQIAKKEATKARQKSYIDYRLGVYEPDGSAFNTAAGWATLTANGDGTLLSIYSIGKADEDIDISIVSKRTSDHVWYRGFNVKGVIKLRGSTNDMSDFRVKVCLFSFKRPVDAQQADILSDLPVPCVYNDLNGRPMSEEQKLDYSKVTMLASKVINCRPTRALEMFKPFTLSKYFKQPQKQTWYPADSAGSNPQKKVYFFTAFTDRVLPPDSSGTASQQPEILCNIRALYFQE